MQRLFNRFRAHETITVLSYDPEKRRLAYVDENGHRTSSVIQAGLKIDLKDIAEGQQLRIQYGEITNWTSSMMGGSRFLRYGNRTIRQQIYTGGHCISAIAHPFPKVQLTALRMMEATFGPEETTTHLRNFAEGASTLQEAIEAPKPKYSRHRPSLGIEMKVEKGVLWAEKSIDQGLRLHGAMLHLGETFLPETVLLALPGRHITDLVDHPLLQDPEMVIEEAFALGQENRIQVRLATTLLTPEEAIARLRGRLAMAA